MILKMLLGGAAALTLSSAAVAQPASSNAPGPTNTSTTPSESSGAATTTAGTGTAIGPDTSAWTTPGITAPGVAGGVAPYEPAGVAGGLNPLEASSAPIPYNPPALIAGGAAGAVSVAGGINATLVAGQVAAGP